MTIENIQNLGTLKVLPKDILKTAFLKSFDFKTAVAFYQTCKGLRGLLSLEQWQSLLLNRIEASLKHTAPEVLPIGYMYFSIFSCKNLSPQRKLEHIVSFRSVRTRLFRLNTDALANDLNLQVGGPLATRFTEALYKARAEATFTSIMYTVKDLPVYSQVLGKVSPQIEFLQLYPGVPALTYFAQDVEETLKQEIAETKPVNRNTKSLVTNVTMGIDIILQLAFLYTLSQYLQTSFSLRDEKQIIHFILNALTETFIIGLALSASQKARDYASPSRRYASAFFRQVAPDNTPALSQTVQKSTPQKKK